METKIPGWLLGTAGVALFGAAWWWHASSEGTSPERAGQSPSDTAHLSHPASLTDAPESTPSRNASSSSRAGRPSAQTLVQVLPVIETAHPDIAAFRAWAHRYFETADPALQAALVPEGIRLADAHRQALKTVISSDPRTAIEQAVPMVVRQALPQGVTDHLEARLSGVGAYDVLAVSPDSDPSEPTVRRFATLNGTEYRAHIYGRRDSQMSTSQSMLNGIAVDREFAMNESPVRPLETGEVPDATKQAVEVCPVSGEKTEVPRTETGTLPPIAPETPALEAGSQIIYLCDGGHIRQYEEEILAGEGATGGPGAPTGTFPITRIQSTGVRKFIYMRLVFPDRLQEPQNEKDAQANVKSITDYFQELSYGKLTFMGTVTPLILLPRTAAWYAEDYNVTGSNSPIMNDAKEAARKLGFPSEDFNHFVVIYAGGPGSFGGLGSVNGPNTWLKSTNVGVADHELGHNVGVWHSNSWNTGGVSVIGSGANVEYGHTNDVMGASGSNGHFNASMKEQLQWLTPETYHTVRSSGTFRLYQFDQVRQDPARRYALKVAKDADRDYWLEFRQKLASNLWYMNGVTVNWSPWGYGSGADNGTTRGSNRGTQLLDMTPGSPDDRTDSPLVIGRTFSDYESDVHITPIGKGGTVPESMDVVVNTGTMAAGNLPPTLSVSASATSVTVGTSVTLTATASDPNGDTLAYAWDFGDAANSFSTNNSASQSKSFSSTGRYQVRCTVSDMKGGSLMRSVLITVGGSVAPIITGTVLDGSGNPIANARVHNGLTLASYRGSFTDSAGAYTVTNIGTTTPLIVVKEGWSFTVPPDGPVQNFTGTEAGVQLTIQAIDSDAGEGGNTGVFRISRTGATTTALTVYTDLAGTASLGGDYALSPAAATTAAPLEAFTLPIGSSFLDITVNVTDDGNQEGPEAVVMALINGSNAYVIRGSQTAQVNVSDNDTSLPQVSLEVVDAEAAENAPSDRASFRVSRTGGTSNSLTVAFTIDGSPGTAANGTDYASIGTSVVIPAGAASALLEVSPINDSLVEGMEVVTVTVSSSGAYVRSALQSGTVKINDDDIAAVNLAVTDNSANENGDVAQFTITRTGGLANALLVHYAISGTATHGADYLTLPGFVTIPAGSASAVVDIIPIQDAHGEPAQTVILQLRSSTLYTLSTSSNATVTINDDNDLPVVAVTLPDGTVAEGGAADPGTFRIVTTGTGSGTITVNYAITGTASSGSDFTALTGSIPVGKNATADIVVTPLNDSLTEDAESVTLTLQPSSGYQLDLQDQSTMMIKDDDSPGMVSVTATTTSVGEGGTGKINISRTGSTAAAITVRLAYSGTATSGSDYSALPSSVSLATNVATASVSVAVIDDSSPEGVESFVVSLLPDAGSPALYGRDSGVTTLLITDNDTGFTSNVGFAQTSRIVDEGTGSVSLTVTRSGSTAGIATVDYTINAGSALGSGVDYRLAAGTLTFPAGATSAAIPVQIMDDVLPEDVETVVVILQNASQAAITTSLSQCTVMILDNEPRVSIEATDPIAYENGGNNAAFKVSRTGSTNSALTVPLVVSGTSTSGSDYTALPASVTIPAGGVTYFLSVAPVQDATQESVETVTVTLGPSGSFLPGDQSAASVSIGDAVANNPPLLALLSPRGTGQGVPLGTALWIDVMASDDGRPGPVTYSWAKHSGPGTVTFSPSTSASTAASFSLAGAYVLRLTASDGTLTSTLDASIFVGAPVDPWTNTDIGAVSLPGSGVDADDVHAVNGNGSWVWNASDNVFFRYRHLVGNGEISARVRQMPNTSTSARVGVMLRESTAVGAKMAGMYMAPATANLSASHVRTSVGGSVVSTSNAGLSPSYWVKVVRNSGILTTFDSPDGNEWTQRGSSTAIGFTDDILAGIAVVSANTARLSTALVDNVRIIGAPENNGPTVNAGPDGAASVNTPRTLAGSASDGDARPTVPGAVSVQWSQVSGPPGVSFANITAANTTVTLPQGGVYVLRLTADDGAVKTCDDVTLTVDHTVVGVAGGIDPAYELDLVPATFVVFRSGNIAGPLTLNFVVTGGEATSGVDYQPLGTSVTIPAGQAYADIPIIPLPDDLAEGQEYILVSLVPDPAYIIGEYASGSNYIYDLPVDDWRYQQFGPNANSPDSAPLADYDLDGVPNLLEYAFHSDPTQPGANLPVPDQQGDSLSIIFTRDKWAYDLEYHVEWSPDLAAGHWYETGVTESTTAINLQYETVRATYTPNPPGSRCFMRVRIVSP